MHQSKSISSRPDLYKIQQLVKWIVAATSSKS